MDNFVFSEPFDVIWCQADQRQDHRSRLSWSYRSDKMSEHYLTDLKGLPEELVLHQVVMESSETVIASILELWSG